MTVLLGIDGGGTKTAVAAWDPVTGRFAEARGGRSAVVGRPSEAACRTLCALADQALAALGAARADVGACAIGLSGIDFVDELPEQLDVVGRALALPVLLVNDAIVALWGASPSPAAVILQHGTAITSAYRAAFGEERCFDHLDAGRQLDLRTECVIRVARMIDGRAPRTALAGRVLAHLGIEDASLLHELAFRRRLGPAASTLGAVVFAAAEEGDEAAVALVDAALADYATTSIAMIHRSGSRSPEVTFGGGVLDAAPARWRARLEATVRAAAPEALVGRPRLRPERGALVMAAHRTGLDPGEAFARLAAARA